MEIGSTVKLPNSLFYPIRGHTRREIVFSPPHSYDYEVKTGSFILDSSPTLMRNMEAIHLLIPIVRKWQGRGQEGMGMTKALALSCQSRQATVQGDELIHEMEGNNLLLKQSKKEAGGCFYFRMVL